MYLIQRRVSQVAASTIALALDWQSGSGGVWAGGELRGGRGVSARNISGTCNIEGGCCNTRNKVTDEHASNKKPTKHKQNSKASNAGVNNKEEEETEDVKQSCQPQQDVCACRITIVYQQVKL